MQAEDFFLFCQAGVSLRSMAALCSHEDNASATKQATHRIYRSKKVQDSIPTEVNSAKTAPGDALMLNHTEWWVNSIYI